MSKQAMTATIPTLRFKADAATRKRLFYLPPDYAKHPAKGNMFMWQECIERYSKEGDTILDPMAGIGTTLLAALMGRNVVCVELEAHFVDPMRRSWEKMRQHPMLGCELGTVSIHQGDARDLGDVLADCVVTSPPYQVEAPGLPSGTGAGAVPGQHGTPYTRKPVDCVVTSPPYQIPETSSCDTSSPAQGGAADHRPGREGTKWQYTRQQAHGYTRPDLLLTSPPYEGVADANKNTNTNDGLRGHPETQGKPLAYAVGDNIGNLRGPAYWTAMRQVYAECFRVLRPGGVLCLVLKGFTRAGEYVDLPQQTADMLTGMGFIPYDHWRRELASLSFWRILQSTDKVEEVVAHRRGLFDLDVQEVKLMKRVSNGKMDERLRFEEVLAFRKPEGTEGNGITTIITSPPYEGSVDELKPGTSRGIRTRFFGNEASAGRQGYSGGYTRPVDAIITSPPYEGSLHPNSDPPFEEIPWSDPKRVGISPHSQVRASTGYTRPEGGG